MIKEILEKEITPIPQRGKAVYFRRRKPAESRITRSSDTLKKLYDFIRMLDAEGYPRAFIEFGPFRVEFTRALLKKNILMAKVKIILK
jgi:methionyl-tRNA formyltransferase